MSRCKLALVVAAWAFAAPARADFQLWNEAGASVEVVDDLKLGFDQQLRLDDGASEVDLVRPGAYVSWRAVKWLALRLGYRFKIEPHYTKGADYADGWHQVYVDSTLRQKLHGARVSLRVRFEEEQGRPWDADGELVRSWAVRQRLEAEWPVWRKIDLVGSGELFVNLGDPDGLLHKWRASVGLALDKGSHQLSVRYLLDYPLTAGDEVAHVLGLSYHFAR